MQTNLSNVHIFILTVNPNQQVPMQSGQGGQSSSKSDFGLEDLNFDPDTLIGADGTGEQTDFGNVRFILNTFQALIMILRHGDPCNPCS